MKKLKEFSESINRLKKYGVEITQEQRNKQNELLVTALKNAIAPILEIAHMDMSVCVSRRDNKIEVLLENSAKIYRIA